MPYQRIRMSPFRGLNENENQLSIGSRELSEAMNVWTIGETLGTRPGTQLDPDVYSTALNDGATTPTSYTYPIQGLYDFRRNQDADRTLLVVSRGATASSEVWIDPDETNRLDKTTNSVVISAGADNQWTFTDHKNVVYAAGGADGDSIWSWDGTNPLSKITFQSDTDDDGVADADIDAKYILQWRNWGFLAGLNGTVPDDNPMVVRYSTLSDMTEWPIGNTIGANPGGGIGGLDSYGSNYITGLSSWSGNDGDWLIVMTRRALYPVFETGSLFTPFRVANAIANGCVAQDAFVSLGVDAGDAIYLSEHGIHSLKQSQEHGFKEEKFLSWKIRQTFNTINKSRAKYVKGAYWKRYGLVVFAIPTGSSIVNDTILALDVTGIGKDSFERPLSLTAETARWYVWKLGGAAATYSINTMAQVRDASGADNRREFIYIGNHNSQVGRFNTTTHTDIGAQRYAATFQTKHDDYEIPGREKTVGDIWISMQPTGDHKVQVQPVFDFGRRRGQALQAELEPAGAIWDTSVWDVDSWGGEGSTWHNRLYGSGAGETVGIRVSHAGEDEEFRVAALSVDIDGTAESFDSEAT